MFRREIIQSITIEENRFGFEPEITAKIARKGCKIYEVGISYAGRTYAEGKKINWKDGMRAIWSILKYNLGWNAWAKKCLNQSLYSNTKPLSHEEILKQYLDRIIRLAAWWSCQISTSFMDQEHWMFHLGNSKTAVFLSNMKEDLCIRKPMKKKRIKNGKKD